MTRLHARAFLGSFSDPPARVLMLRCISFAPKGRPQKSPGRRPGRRLRNLRQSPVRATHRRSAVAPLQGFSPRFSRFFASPGRCPGLFCPAPSGPKPHTAQNQNVRAGPTRIEHDLATRATNDEPGELHIDRLPSFSIMPASAGGFGCAQIFLSI
jgi:hypothetical protein